MGCRLSSRSSQRRCCCWPRHDVQGQEPPIFSADSELVVLHVTVKDRKGAYVAGLTQDAFNVIEDGRAQTVRLFTDTDTPVTVGLLDRQQRQHASAPAADHRRRHGVCEASHPRDEIFALAFNEDVTPALPPTRAVHERRQPSCAAALERSVSSRGRTALYDAISAGVDYLSRGHAASAKCSCAERRRRQRQPGDRDDAVRKAQASNAVIYTIALIEPGVARRQSESAEGTVAGERRRVVSAARSPEESPTRSARIARDIRHTYTIGYTSTNTARDGAFRSVRVVVTAPPGRPLVVRSRPATWQEPTRDRHDHTLDAGSLDC